VAILESALTLVSRLLITLVRRLLTTLVRRLLIREFLSARQLLVASSREFEAASGSEFDVPTASCNNHATTSIYDSVEADFDQERQQELFNDVEKFLQDQGDNEVPPLSHVFGSNQYPKIRNSSLAMVSELGWSHLAETPTVPSRAESGVFDTGAQLAQLVAAEDPSVALVSGPGWPGFFNNKKQSTNAINDTWSTLPVKDNGEQLLKLVAAEDPSAALVSDRGWLDTAAENTISSASQNGQLDTAEVNINSTGGPSLTTHQVQSNQTVTLTLPVVSSSSLEQLRVQPLDDSLLAMAVEASGSLEANNSSLGTNLSSLSTNTGSLGTNIGSLGTNNSSLGTNIRLISANNTTSSPKLQVANYPSEPVIDVAGTRPSVIVSTRSSRKRGFNEIDGINEKNLILEKNAPVPISTTILMPELTVDDNQDEIPPALLEKRMKGNARCKKYRVNKKKKEAIEETELEMLTRRNELLREEEKRLTDRKRKLQQSYLSLIRQKKIRFQ